MKYSDKQIAIGNSYLNSTESLVVRAAAGSGKTSSLLYLLDLVKKKTLYLAFNKSVQEEVQTKFEKRGFKHAKSMTIHGLGMQTLRTEYNKLDVSNNKNWGIINTLQKEQPALYRGLSVKNKYALNFTLIELNNSARTWYTEDLDTLTKILKANGTNVAKLPCLKDAWRAFIVLRDKGYEAKSYLEIDYLDMVYLPVKLGLEVPVKPSYLLIDESQDLSLIQHMFVDLLINQPTLKKFVAVGDPHQAIYGFSGAMSDSYRHFYNKSKPVVELPLDVTYRCPKLIVDEANAIHPGMIAHKETDGIVRTETVTDFSLIEDESMIVCRNTEPLIDVYLNLVAAGKAAYLDGDNFLKYLKKFVNYYMNQTVADTLEKLSKEYDQKLAKSRGDEDRLELFIFKENLNILNKVAKTFSFYGKTIKELLNQFENIFKTRKNSIVLCTIHKAKGLECDTVYFLEPGLIPSKFATTEEQLIQEENLRYVAVTRAKEKLIYLKVK